MKKSIIFLLIATAFLFTACEQPEAPQSLIGHWNVVGDHWTATFDEDGQLYISSTKYDTGLPYHYYATSDSLYFSWIVNMLQPTPDPVVCSYHFKGNNTLVIDGFNAVFQDMGSVADKITKKDHVVLTRTHSLR